MLLKFDHAYFMTRTMVRKLSFGSCILGCNVIVNCENEVAGDEILWRETLTSNSHVTGKSAFRSLSLSCDEILGKRKLTYWEIIMGNRGEFTIRTK